MDRLVNDLIITIRFLWKKTCIKFKRLSFKELLTMCLLLLSVTILFSSYYDVIVQYSSNYQYATVIYLFTGLFTGLLFSLACFHEEEYTYLYQLLHRRSILTFHLVLQMTFYLIFILLFLFAVSLMKYHLYDFHTITQSYLEVSLGIILGVHVSIFLTLPRDRQVIFIISILCSCFISIYFKNHVILLFLIMMLMYSLYINIQVSWDKRLFYKGKSSEPVMFKVFKMNPIVKKEIILHCSFNRFIPLLLTLLVVQVIMYFLYQNEINTIFVFSILFIVLLHDAWTINSIGLEGKVIYLYLSNHIPLRQVFLFKFIWLTIIIQLIGTLFYLWWSMIYGDVQISVMIKELISLFIFNLIISMAYIILSLRYANFDDYGYYRLHFFGLVLAGFFLLGVVVSYTWFKKLMVIQLLLLMVYFFWVFRSEQSVRRFLRA